MDPTKTIHRSLDMLAVLIFSGCLVGITGNIIDNHAIDMQNIFEKFDALIKPDRVADVGAVKPVICILFGQIDAIKEDMRQAYSFPFDLRFSSYCSDTDILKAKILIFRGDLKRIVKLPISSLKYRQRKSVFEDDVLNFKVKLNEYRKKLEDKELQIMDTFHAQFQTLTDLIQGVLSQMELEQVPLNDEMVEITVKKLDQANVAEALAAFMNITERDIQIDRIVASVNGSRANFGNILQFVIKLPNLTRLNGFKAMHNQLMRNNGSSDHRIWVVATSIKELVNDDVNRKRKVMKNVANDLKDIVRNSSLDGLIKYFNDGGAAAIVTLKYVVKILVRTIYDSTGQRAKNFLSILQNLTSVHQRLSIINEFVAMLKVPGEKYSDDMSLLVYELIKLRSVRKPEDEYLVNLIERNLPKELRSLLYNNLCIQNVENNEYLYPGEAHFDESVDEDPELERYVHTGNIKNGLNVTFYWQVNFIKNGTRVIIKNNKYKEYVYISNASATYLGEDNFLKSWIPTNNSLNYDFRSEFDLIMIGNGQFYIYNDYYEQVWYLQDTDPYLQHERFVRSCIYEPDLEVGDLPESQWIIDFCRVYVEYNF